MDYANRSLKEAIAMENEIIPGHLLAPQDGSLLTKAKFIAQVGYDTFTTTWKEGMSQTEAGQRVLDGGRKVADSISEAYEGATKASSKLVDNLSGAEAMTQIEALLNQQRRYNFCPCQLSCITKEKSCLTEVENVLHPMRNKAHRK